MRAVLLFVLLLLVVPVQAQAPATAAALLQTARIELQAAAKDLEASAPYQRYQRIKMLVEGLQAQVDAEKAKPKGEDK